jgi:outer membrane protein TolC
MGEETMNRKIREFSQNNCSGRRWKRVLSGIWISLVFYSLAPTLFDLNAAEPEKINRLEAEIQKKPSIEDLIEYAYQENPSIQVARHAWKATIENVRVATGYPDPELMVTYYPEPIETRLGPQDWNASISQRIPFPGKLSKSGEIAAMETSIAKLNLDRTIRDVIVSTRESFSELIYIRNARRVAGHNMKLLEHLRKVGETAYAQDRATLLDMVKAQSQVGQLRYDIILLEGLEQTEIARLNGLLNRPPEAPIGRLQAEIAIPIVYTLAEIYSLAETSQQEIQMAKVEVEKAGKKAELARYENFPEFKVGLFYAGIGSPDVSTPPPNAGDDAIGIQAGISLPIWFGKNSGRMARAGAEMKKAEASKAVLINDTRTQIRAIYFRLQNSQRLVELYQNDLLPQAAKAMEIAETWFRENQSPFSDFIEAQSVWYNFELALARAQADYGKYLARLERLVGHSITAPEDASIQDTKMEEK